MIFFPAELGKKHWDGKKGAVPAKGDLESALQDLEKAHQAVDWKRFDEGWADDHRSISDLNKAFKALEADLDKHSRSLLAKADAVETAAKQLGKDKASAKPSQDAASAIAKALVNYRKTIEAAGKRLGTQADDARFNLEQTSDGGDADEPAGALLDPKRLLGMLQRCRRDPTLQMQFGFIAGDGKDVEPALAVAPRTPGKKLFADLGEMTGVKLGSFGTLSVDKTTLLLRLDKNYSGMVKKVRIPLKACGFKITVVRILGPGGEEESDTDAEAGEHNDGETGAPKAANAAIEHALASWKQARESAITVLKDAAREIAGLRDAESAKAITMIKAVIAKLTAEPTEQRQVVELVRFVDKDEVVADVSQYATEIRKPLLQALAGLHKATAA